MTTMNTMIQYGIDVTIAWSVLLGIYLLFLRKETFFRTNRLFLINSLWLGIVIPLLKYIPISFSESDGVIIDAVIFISEGTTIPIAAVSDETSITLITWENLLLAIYFVGVAVVLTRFLLGLFKIRKIYTEGEKQVCANCTVVITDRTILPFSFLDKVFLNRSYLENSHFQNILDHEMTHIKHRHTYDVLLVELVSILFWWNPFIYLYKREIKQNHEYIADAYASNQTHTENYGQILLGHSSSGLELALTNQFFNSHLKKRINMLYKKKSARHKMSRYLVLIPCLLFLSILFSSNSLKNKNTLDPKLSINHDGLEGRDLVEEDILSLLEIITGKENESEIKFNTCINREGKVVFAELLKETTTLISPKEQKNILRTYYSNFKYSADENAPKEECGQVTIKVINLNQKSIHNQTNDNSDLTQETYVSEESKGFNKSKINASLVTNQNEITLIINANGEYIFNNVILAKNELNDFLSTTLLTMDNKANASLAIVTPAITPWDRVNEAIQIAESLDISTYIATKQNETEDKATNNDLVLIKKSKTTGPLRIGMAYPYELKSNSGPLRKEVEITLSNSDLASVETAENSWTENSVDLFVVPKKPTKTGEPFYLTCFDGQNEVKTELVIEDKKPIQIQLNKPQQKPITYVSERTYYTEGMQDPLIVINGKISESKEEHYFTESLIKNVQVLEGQEATSKYGDKAINGVIEFSTAHRTHPVSKAKSDQEIFKVVEEMPRFPGCEDQGLSDQALEDCAKNKMLKFIYTNIKYPAIARQNKVQGMVVVQFIVNEDGKTSDFKIVRSIDGSCDDATLDMLQTMADKHTWIPGKQRGKAVKVLYTLPVKFKLRDDEKKQVSESTKSETEIGKLLPIKNFDDCENPAVIIDGKYIESKVIDDRLKSDVLNDIDPETIKGISVFIKDGIPEEWIEFKDRCMLIVVELKDDIKESEVITIEAMPGSAKNSEKTALTLLGNPVANGVLEFTYASELSEDLHIDIHDQNGKLIKSEVRGSTGKRMTEKISLDSVIPGNYILRIKQGEATSLKKFVVL